MEFSWKESPFLRILIPMMVGILLFDLFDQCNYWVGAVVCMVSVIFLRLYGLLDSFVRKRFQWVKGLMIQLFITAFAYTICGLHSIRSSEIWYRSYLPSYRYAIVKVKDDAIEKPKTSKIVVDFCWLVSDSLQKKVEGSAILYLQKSTQSLALQAGDYLLVRNKLTDIKSLGNPGEFNYSEFCHRQQIYQSAFLKNTDWKRTTIKSKSIQTYINHAGRITRSSLKKYIHNPVSFGIAEALLIGYRNDIDPEIWQAYSNTGIVHIIAISGMHMAMIYSSIRWLLLLIPFVRRHRFIAILVAVIGMWFFAAITGLPPSVTRAAIMFTCWGLGELLVKKLHGMNNLAMSACVLLCINPWWLFDVGFQLSYLAVLSLILFYSYIYQRICISNFILDQIWKLIAATLAAQILTFPLCIYYFHQFPLLFLLTNLVAVPFTTFILYLEIIYVFFSWINVVGRILGSTISTFIEWMNNAVSIVSKWSFALWDGIFINSIQVILLYCLLICITQWCVSRKPKFLQVSLLIVLCFSCIELIREYQILNQQKIIVYNLNGQSRIEFISGNQYYVLYEDSLNSTKSIERYTLKPSHLCLGVSKGRLQDFQFFKNQFVEIYSYHNKTIMRILNPTFQFKEKLSIDYLILSKGSINAMNTVLATCNPKLIILDSSIPYWRLEACKSSISSFQIPVYSVHEKGAFLASF